jgi:hypothetical protein
LCVNKSQSAPVIFEPPCVCVCVCVYIYIYIAEKLHKCAFVGLYMNNKLTLMHSMEHMKSTFLFLFQVLYIYIYIYILILTIVIVCILYCKTL